MFNALIVLFVFVILFFPCVEDRHNFTVINVACLRSLNQSDHMVLIWIIPWLINCSVKATIDRYKKASSDSTNTGSTSEANTQVHFNFTKFREE